MSHMDNRNQKKSKEIRKASLFKGKSEKSRGDAGHHQGMNNLLIGKKDRF